MNKEMLKQKNVQIIDRVSDWEEAVKVSLTPLVEGGYVEPRYIDSVIKATRELGPYYVLTKDVALIHGRPEDGVTEKQLGVTVLRNAVDFVDQDHSARLLVALAAEDADSHIDVMRALASIFMEDEKVQKIIEAKTENEIYEMFMDEMTQVEE